MSPSESLNFSASQEDDEPSVEQRTVEKVLEDMTEEEKRKALRILEREGITMPDEPDDDKNFYQKEAEITQQQAEKDTDQNGH